MPVTSEYVNMIKQLIYRGVSGAQAYLGTQITTPQSMQILLLYNGQVVATLPVSQIDYDEDELTPQQAIQTLVFKATDNSSNSYQFNEVQLWGGNEYIVTDDKLPSTEQKQSSSPISVEVEISIQVTQTVQTSLTVEQSVNVTTYLAHFGVLIYGSNNQNICTNQDKYHIGLLYGSCNQKIYPEWLNYNIADIVIILTLIPPSYFTQIPQDTRLYQVLQNQNVRLENLQGIVYNGLLMLIPFTTRVTYANGSSPTFSTTVTAFRVSTIAIPTTIPMYIPSHTAPTTILFNVYQIGPQLIQFLIMQSPQPLYKNTPYRITTLISTVT